MQNSNENAQLYKVVLDALMKTHCEPTEAVEACANALTILLLSMGAYHGDKEQVKNSAMDMFEQILEHLDN